MDFIRQLEVPILKPVGDEQIELTHKCYGISHHHPWNRSALSIAIHGRMIDGVFVPQYGTEEISPIEREDYRSLTGEDEQGKIAGRFRTDDVIAIHEAVQARLRATVLAPMPEEPAVIQAEAEAVSATITEKEDVI